MGTMLQTAQKFFEACETGKGWAGCKAYCTLDASFSAQSAPLLETKTLAAYADWMKGMFTPFPDASYELKSFAVDERRQNVSAFAVFKARNTGPGGPVPPTGKSIATDYVYVMQFKGDKIAHMTKIWNDSIALKQAGWI
jgi:predicted ester cyclase